VIIYKSLEEIELMREAALVVSRTLGVIAERIGPGVTPLELDKLAETYIRDQGACPGFLGMYDYKFTLCTSVNEQVVHGIPDNRPLQEGDIISVDCGAILHDFYGDHAYTFAIGEIDPKVRRLLDVTLESLNKGIEQVKVGNRMGDMSFAIQQHAEKHGYGVVRELVGHGIGRKLHESPEVPNYGKKGSGPKFQNGMVLAIEPMINMGKRNIRQLRDGWTIVTADGLPAAHFEHDVAIVNGQADVLSTFAYVEAALAKKQA
jgi:methionyl aminopeptidase